MSFHRTGRKFGREKGVRTALVKSLVRSLIIHDAITTTEAKAKTIRPIIEKLVTRAKGATLADKRILISRIGDPKAAKRLVDTIAPTFKSRSGGYTRIIKLPIRKKDSAKMAQISFVK
jgi:large subunit ribosomal protein L17